MMYTDFNEWKLNELFGGARITGALLKDLKQAFGKWHVYLPDDPNLGPEMKFPADKFFSHDDVLKEVKRDKPKFYDIFVQHYTYITDENHDGSKKEFDADFALTDPNSKSRGKAHGTKYGI